MDKRQKIRMLQGNILSGYYPDEILDGIKKLLKEIISEVKNMDEEAWLQLNRTKRRVQAITDRIKLAYEDLEEIYLRKNYLDFKSELQEIKAKIINSLRGIESYFDDWLKLGEFGLKKEQSNLPSKIRKCEKRVEELLSKFLNYKSRIEEAIEN